MVASPSIQPSLAVSVSGGTAITSVPFTDAALAKMTFTATDGDIKTSSLTVIRSGISADSDFTNIRLVDSLGTQFGYPANFVNGKAVFNGINFVTQAGFPRTLAIRANVTQTLTPGKTVMLTIDGLAASHPVSGSAIYSAVVPPSVQVPVTLSSIPAKIDSSVPVQVGSPFLPTATVSDGSLVKMKDNPDVYVIQGGQKVKITSPQEFEQKGYRWDQIKEVERSLLEQIAELKAQVKQLREELARTGALLKSLTAPDVYVIKDGKKERIPDPETFNKRGYKWGQIQEVSADELSQIPDYASVSSASASSSPAASLPKGIAPGSLVKSPDSPTVYFITQAGLKKPIPSIAVFNSYGNKWENVKTIAQDQLGAYPVVKTIKLERETKIYLLSDGKKQWVKTSSAFEKLGLKWGEVVQVNQAELDAYPEGEPISENSSSVPNITPIKATLSVANALSNFAGGQSFEQLIGKYRFTNTSSGDYSITVADIDLGISSTISVSASATRYVTLKRDSVAGTTIAKKGFRSSFADITNFTAASGDGSEVTFSPFTIASSGGTGFVNIFVLIDTVDAAAAKSISTSIGGGSNVVTWSDGATNNITALANIPINGATAIY